MGKESVNVLRSAVVVLSEGLDFEHPAIKFSAKKMWKTAQWADEPDMTDEHVEKAFPSEVYLAYEILSQSERGNNFISSEKIREFDLMFAN